MKRFLGILAVWVGCTFAWVVLGSALVMRSGESSSSLAPEVQELWGPPLQQEQPRASYTEMRMVRNTRTLTDGAGQTSTETSEREEPVDVPIELVSSDLAVRLDLEHRRRGLMWFPTYGVDFRGRYVFENPSSEARVVTIVFPLTSSSTVYDGFRVQDEAGRPIDAAIGLEQTGADSEPRYDDSARWQVELAPNARAAFLVSYRTRGTESWRYRMGVGTTRVTDFRLAMTTNFEDVDFPAGTLSPTRHAVRDGGWRGTWTFDSLIANQPIGVEPPTRINPGPLASRITFFAPVGLLFFFFVVAVLAGAQRRDMHPMHFFFIGCSFFAFHLLFSYLVDHLAIGPSFAMSAGVSLLLCITYARLFVGWRFALREIGVAQVIYLVLFSASFLLEGFTGLAITLGAVLTLFVMMQITGRTAWGAARKAEAARDDAPTAVPNDVSTSRPVAF